MIIKSLTRKQPSFDNLLAYLNRRQRNDGYTYHCWSDGKTPAKTAAEFYQNYQHLPKRANGNALYHEIIALPQRPGLETRKQVYILKDLLGVYIEKRAPEQLVYVHIHEDDTDYVHGHLMISANRIGSNKRQRLSKAQFAEIKRELEVYKLEHYGGLFPERLLGREAKYTQTHKEYALKQRSQSPSRNDRVRDSVQEALYQSRTLADFKHQLEQRGFQLYQRGQTWGVWDRGIDRKFRLKTLGLADAIQQIERLQQIQGLHRIEREVERDLTGFER